MRLTLNLLTFLKKRYHLFWLGICFGLLSACDQSDSTSRTQPTLNTEQSPLILAVLPYDLPTSVQAHFEPFLRYLTETTGRPVKLYIATSYEDQIQKVVAQQVDLAYMGATIYVKTQKVLKQSHQPLLTPIATEAPYQAAIVVHSDSKLKTISDLKNHRVAFGAYFSYTGHFAIRNELKKADVSLADLSFYSFLKRHNRSILSVVHHQFDAAATPLGIAERMIAQDYPIKILHTTKTLAPIVLAATPKLPSQITNEIHEALIHPTFNQEITLSQIKPKGFFPFDETPYQTVLKTLNQFEQ